MIPEAAGIQPFQQGAVLLKKTCQSAGDPPLGGILYDGVDGSFGIAGANGEEVYASAVELGEKQQPVIPQGSLLPAPEVEIHKAVLAAPFPAVEKIPVIFRPVRNVKGFKVDHFDYILWFKTVYFIIPQNQIVYNPLLLENSRVSSLLRRMA